MKKTLVSLLIAVMLFGIVLVPAALAQNPAYSSIQVLNLGATDASISIYYYNQDGSQDLASPVSDTVLVGESNTYFPVHAADGFNGSVVIESTEPIAVISNILYTAPLFQSSWNGFDAGASAIRFPLIMKGNNSNNTTFNVQNVTADPVDILIEFVPEPGAGYAAITNVTDTIPAFAARTYDQATMGVFSGVTKWVGSAKVSVTSATGAIAGVAQQIDTARNTGTAYNAFLSGVATVEMPLVMKDNNNMWTSINCQNLGPGATDITVNFVPEAGYPAMAAETKTAVAENGTAVFIQYGAPKWVGAATVTNTAGNQLACIGNQSNLVSFYASAYEGFDSSAASSAIVSPLVQFQPQADGNLWTSINIKNLGGTATTATVDFKPAPGFGDVANMTVGIDPNALG
ncbi:MAG: hypothetical protein M8467_08590, partial [Anaerolineae bacterium]|nr:hypothetical protein [Anaerolineae bacterium]